MFAPQNQQPNAIDSMSGSMEDWYNAIGNAVKKSDVIPGNYEYTVNPSYCNVADVIDQYRISSNNDLIQTQNHARYEWFIQYNIFLIKLKRIVICTLRYRRFVK